MIQPWRLWRKLATPGVEGAGLLVGPPKLIPIGPQVPETASRFEDTARLDRTELRLW
jgi:hypothetical protein